MPVNSSTSASDRGFVRSAVVAFAVAAALMIVPYETAVRMSEKRYGVRRANITIPLGLAAKVDAFFSEIEAGHAFTTYLVGSSQVEEGIRPDLIEPVTGPTYNLGIQGASAIPQLEMLERLGIQLRHLIIGVSIMDFTPLAMVRGEKVIWRAEAISAKRANVPETRGPAAAARRGFYALLHCSTPERKRNFGQWLDFVHNRGPFLAFLNNEFANRRLDNLWIRGYIGKHTVASAERFAERGLTISQEYAEGHQAMMARFAAVVRRFRARGAAVVLVQLPQSPGMRRWTAEKTTFEHDLPVLLRQIGSDYIDGDVLMGAAFVADRRNFSDPSHLNVTGSTAFTTALARAIQQKRGGPEAAPRVALRQ